MNIDTYRKCTNWNTGYRIDVLTPVFSIYQKPVWYSSRDVPNNNLEDVCQWLIKFTINSPFASSSSCLLSLSACHTWSHTCLDRARWSARRDRLLIHLPQAIPIPASAFNMNDCLLVTSSHGIRFKNLPEGLKIDAVSGRTARRLVENIIAGTYKEPVRPYRVVYIFGGGNDLGPRDRRTITRDNVFRLWDDIEYLVAYFESFVQAVVVLCPIPRPKIGRHNQQMLETAETLLRAKLGRKKSVLMFKHFDPDRHFVDGIHLNKAGYTVLRRRLLRQ